LSDQDKSLAGDAAEGRYIPKAFAKKFSATEKHLDKLREGWVKETERRKSEDDISR